MIRFQYYGNFTGKDQKNTDIIKFDKRIKHWSYLNCEKDLQKKKIKLI